ncbi:ATP-binding protein [Actinomyces ruminicola]|uniref:ATP-dependent DNA helicase RecG n=1 Tax=Actinomyces ruminicola TaxID=332524 RepID=A0A1H0A6Q4_9ACTO|nr:ATP-binding protein [Actinomyces ruminicola]SDN28904.1 ATP-dependent DNA helicase RecG [Actinomyces ruminicola]
MIVDEQDLLEALARLELEGGDCLDLEAKTFSEYSRDALGPTLSAFANLPGGGTLLLGVSENPVKVVGIKHPREQMQALASQARQGFSAEISIDPRSIELDGKTVVVANVREVPTNAKPCRWKENGASYLRQYDGDYRMSAQEEQQLLIRHQRPRGDTIPIPNTSINNLDANLVKGFVRNARAGSTALRDQSDAEVLLNLNVLTEEGTATLAGLYALGSYPQRHFPALAITAAVVGDEGGPRATDRLRIDGPIPRMLTAAVEWVSQNARTNIELGTDGHARNVHEYPLVAVRELIANALVHRDLSEPALSKGVEIRLTRDRLIISSPGGLWGLTVDQLGTRDGKSAVNERLYDICTFTTDTEGRRVIEGLGTGIRAVREALRQADIEPVRFQDTGVRFTALLPRAALLSPSDLTWLADLDTEGLGVEQRHALTEMRHGRSWTNSTYRRRFGLDSAQARRQLQELVNLGLAEVSGTKSSTSYALAPIEQQPDSSEHSNHEVEDQVPEEVVAVSANAAAVWSCLATPKTRAQITEATGLTGRQVKWALDRLKTAGFVVFQGRQGSTVTTYRRA